MEKYNFQPNPENRFKVVRYVPTLEMIKKDLINIQNNNWGYCDVLKRIIEEDFEGEDLKMLVKNDIATINILNELTKKSFTDFNQHYGILNIETGELINRFYKEIFSYHPDQGYVIFEQDSDRDFWTGGADPVFRLVSLKTGKEFQEVFLDKKFTSGIRDLKFISYIFPASFDYYEINPITEKVESASIPIPLDQNGQWDLENATGKSNLAYKYYNIEWVDFGQPYFETELFKGYLKFIPDLKRINPYEN
jgi:hypothetical protein